MTTDDLQQGDLIYVNLTWFMVVSIGFSQGRKYRDYWLLTENELVCGATGCEALLTTPVFRQGKQIWGREIFL